LERSTREAESNSQKIQQSLESIHEKQSNLETLQQRTEEEEKRQERILQTLENIGGIQKLEKLLQEYQNFDYLVRAQDEADQKLNSLGQRMYELDERIGKLENEHRTFRRYMYRNIDELEKKIESNKSVVLKPIDLIKRFNRKINRLFQQKQ